jgi:hypothetical protein
VPIEKVQEKSISCSEIIASNGLEVTGGAAALEPCRRLACRIPSYAISLGPKIWPHRVDLSGGRRLIVG